MLDVFVAVIVSVMLFSAIYYSRRRKNILSNKRHDYFGEKDILEDVSIDVILENGISPFDIKIDDVVDTGNGNYLGRLALNMRAPGAGVIELPYEVYFSNAIQESEKYLINTNEIPVLMKGVVDREYVKMGDLGNQERLVVNNYSLIISNGLFMMVSPRRCFSEYGAAYDDFDFIKEQCGTKGEIHGHI